jgi:hypothetical protein
MPYFERKRLVKRKRVMTLKMPMEWDSKEAVCHTS